MATLTYHRRKERHECANCGRQDERTLSGRAYCRECAQKEKETKREKYAEMRRENRCVKCGRQDSRTLSGKAKCEKCADIQSADRIRAQRKDFELGKCRVCGRTGKPLSESCMCSACRKKEAEEDSLRYKTRRQNHQCTICGKQDRRTLDGKCVCSECSDMKAVRKSEKNRYLKASGRCITCGAEDALTMAGRIRCGACLEKDREYRRSRREENPRVYSARAMERYYEYGDFGLCRKCGSKLPDGYEYVLCQKCRDRRNASRRSHYRPVWHDPDLCAICHKKPKMDGFKVCEECRATCIRNLPPVDTVDRKNHPWRIDNRWIFRKRNSGDKQ